MEVGGQRHAPAALPPRKRPPVHFIGGGWLGLGASLDGYGKSRTWVKTRTVQPVESPYTNYAIPATCYLKNSTLKRLSEPHICDRNFRKSLFDRPVVFRNWFCLSSPYSSINQLV
jgi:hypothetical protein